ncbi:nuclease [Metarhizobium album]|uniref:Nuclease n=1 Tax=Metarhizobium album TaxID=2182425 RepID=A0A2U2DL49_9HYPH|nr:thermonuclease family protein [Rhizobium album]PWE54029.1 nuclease [Rhizobium album]
MKAWQFILFALCAAPAGAAETIVGRASVIDADTIEIRGERIRLNGIDAPESWQRCEDGAGGEYRCGKDAAAALDAFLAASRPTSCIVVDHDRYRRAVADCVRADGSSVNGWLVANGWAVDWVRYSHDRFASEQSSAQTKKLGIWRGQFQLPCMARAERTGNKPAC